jgi:hypothetical protein
MSWNNKEENVIFNLIGVCGRMVREFGFAGSKIEQVQKTR